MCIRDRDLGDDFAEIHARWLNSMANLTLTAYNSKYSNRRFVEKRDMENGFKQSGFRINGFVCQQEAWGEEQLKARNELIKRKFLELWPPIESDFEWSNGCLLYTSYSRLRRCTVESAFFMAGFGR